jgi:DNA-binding transcriptional MocR family regulator
MQSGTATDAPMPPPLAALEHRVLHEAVAARLRELIVEGVLAPGAHLNERVLCAQLAVSRTPLREAFRTLAGEGIVLYAVLQRLIERGLEPLAGARQIDAGPTAASLLRGPSSAMSISKARA